MGISKGRCMVCAKERELSGGICEECKAAIRSEASSGQKKIKRDAERELKKEGVTPKEK